MVRISSGIWEAVRIRRSFGGDKMATFERYFVMDKATHVENKNAYYDFQDDEQTALADFEWLWLE